MRISDWSSDVCSSDLADYRGEIGVILINLGQAPFTIARGDRIAQMVIAPVTQIAWDEADTLSESGRGAGGFGSTGFGRSEERRVGRGCVSTCRSRGAQYHEKKKRVIISKKVER